MIKEKSDVFFQIIWEYSKRQIQEAYTTIATEKGWCLDLCVGEGRGLATYWENPINPELVLGGRRLDDEELQELYEALLEIND